MSGISGQSSYVLLFDLWLHNYTDSILWVLCSHSTSSQSQPTALLSPSDSSLFSDKTSFSRLVLCSSDLNMLTAPALLILQFFNFNQSWTDWLSVSPTAKCSAVWSERPHAFSFESFITLCLKNPTQCPEIMSLVTHDIIPLSIFTSPCNPGIFTPTCIQLRVWRVTHYFLYCPILFYMILKKGKKLSKILQIFNMLPSACKFVSFCFKIDANA